MIRSLRRHTPDARVWVLCLSDEVHLLLTKLNEPGVIPISLTEFEANDSALIAARDDGRTQMDYYFTCTPSLVRYVMIHVPEAEWVTYLDGDLWFFDTPDAIYTEIGDGSVAIIPHRYPPHLNEKHQYGLYNVGWVSFRRTADGIACLDWWRERCLEWCLDVVDEPNDRFADQRYLDRFPKLFSGVTILKNPGANLAPWNIAGHRLEEIDGMLRVDDRPLIFFHFHGLKRVGQRRFLTAHKHYGARVCAIARKHLYEPYLAEILAIERENKPLLPGDDGQTLRLSSAPMMRPAWADWRAAKARLGLYAAILRGFSVRAPARPRGGAYHSRR